MRFILTVQILLLSPGIMASDLYEPKVFTPEVVVDHENNKSDKGAVQLLWTKAQPGTQYEVQVDNGDKVYSSVVNRNYKHIMIYFGNDYKWRVRKVSRDIETQFSAWLPVKVLRGSERARNSYGVVQHSVDMESISLDLGD